MKKVLTVIGARPQFIKAAPVSRAFQNAGFDEILVHTGQHYDPQMSQVFFDELNLPRPAYNLGIGGLSHGAMTGRMLEALENIMFETEPDITLVYGDTNSTLAAALASSKLEVPVAHVEAGLRSFNRKMPEETNRVLTDHMAKWLFAPSSKAVELLAGEGIVDGVSMVGDVMYDALKLFQPLAAQSRFASSMGLEKFGVVTLHRPENTDNPDKLLSILKKLDDISRDFPLVFPVHPRTQKAMERQGIQLEFMRCLEPISYLEMIDLLSHASLVFTDSGGLQKDAYFCEVPCLTLRGETEWIELIDEGVNQLVGADPERIQQGFLAFQEQPPVFPASLYGDGKASEAIASTLSA